jgi:hypothetical protein
VLSSYYLSVVNIGLLGNSQHLSERWHDRIINGSSGEDAKLAGKSAELSSHWCQAHGTHSSQIGFQMWAVQRTRAIWKELEYLDHA